MVPRRLIIVLLVALLSYGAVKAWPLVSGPSITLSSPVDYATVQDGFLTISGTAHRTESLSLDGGPLLIDQEGRFEKTLLLPRGGAILTLTATDRFGRQLTERRTVFVP